MSIQVIDGDPPFVIDRRLPLIFQRAPGVLELVANDDEQVCQFSSPEVAESWLLAEVGVDGLEHYHWTILPKAKTEEPYRPQESSGVYQDALSRCEFLLGGDGYFRCPALVASGERFCDQHSRGHAMERVE